MKYFTPELLARFASKDDNTALPAQEELENRSEQYTKYLKQIRNKLPERFRELQEKFYLHDARVLQPWFPFFIDFRYGPWMYREFITLGKLAPDLWQSIFLELELDMPPREVLVLNYRNAIVDETTLYRPFRGEPAPYLAWQHDEIDILEENGAEQVLHSILVSNGFELRLRFRDFDFARLSPLTKREP